MNNNSWFKKEMPLQTVIGFGGGATGFGAHSSSASKTYVDDVFSTYPYVGSGGSKTITNGIDFSGKGGLLWFKNRDDNSTQNILTDTVRGVDKVFYSDSNSVSTDSTINQSFNSDGWSMSNSYGDMNQNNKNYSSWSFRKQKGFFDMVQYTGNGSARTISHGLGCIPGLIMIKCISTTNSWYVYHRDLGETKYLMLNNNNGSATQSWFMNDTAPTSSVFSLGTSSNVNGSGETYMAYIFAGGESDAATARSVSMDGNDYLTLAQTTDLEPGSGDFTIEAWVKPDAAADGYDYVFSNGWEQQLAWYRSGTDTTFNAWFRETQGGSYVVSLSSSTRSAPRGAWSHVAVVRYGNVFTLYVNGTAESSATHTGAVADTASDLPTIGRFDGSGSNNYHMEGHISNFRYTKGQALYTSSFIPSTEPLTTTSQGATASNVKLLCCNNSSVTGSTVTPGTITNSGSTASTDSPFDDPDGFKFGENEDQVIIKTGKYIGNGASDGPEVYVGFEPQWLMIRGVGGGDWNIVDNMRGIVTGGNDNRLWANLTNAESTSLDVVDITSTGFKIKHSGGSFNATDSMIYMAIRRPDGYVGKPPSAATDVFTMVAGDDTVEPSFAANFAVDYAFSRKPVSSYGMVNINRLTDTNELFFYNDDVTAGSDADYALDYGTGYAKNRNNTYQSWMWKRSAGMDVVTSSITASQGQKEIRHNLNAIPEMIIMKSYTGTNDDWIVYSKYLNGGSNPNDYYVRLNSSNAETSASGIFGTTTPTATSFSIQTNFRYTGIHTFQLFASANDADGNPISKVGSYAGSSSTVTVTTGFQPRMVFIKNMDDGASWVLLDTVRGWTGTNDKYLFLDSSATENTSNYGAPTSTGFTVTTNDNSANGSGYNFLYYAHA